MIQLQMSDFYFFIPLQEGWPATAIIDTLFRRYRPPSAAKNAGDTATELTMAVSQTLIKNNLRCELFNLF